MALENCKDCPNSCFGNTFPSDCVVHEGQSLATRLQDIEDALVNDIDPNSPLSDLTTDQVISVSQIRDTSNKCASSILNRSFMYSLKSTSTTSTFGWNLQEVRSNLPHNYALALTRVRITGNTNAGRNVIVDSNKVANAVSVGLNSYPITVDYLMRITSPCGDIDMEYTSKITNPANTGSFSATLSAKDLNPAFGELMLTEHLNILEDRMEVISTTVEGLSDPTADLAEQEARIEVLETSVADIGSLNITSTEGTDSLQDTINDLYAEVQVLKAENLQQSIEIEALQAQIQSINA